MGTITIRNLIGGAINIITTGGGGNTPPAPVERWVEPVYTNEWVFSDGQEHTIRIDYTDETFDGHLAYNYYIDDVLILGDRANEYEIEISNSNTITAYRKYTPGHWEDADGNWINGSWGEWNTNFVSNDIAFASMEEIYGYGDNEKNWWISVDGEGSFMAMAYPSATNKNVTTIWYGGFIATRTWNNTKPAPTA